MLAHSAQNMLGKPVGVPNNVGFEPFKQPSVRSAKSALEKLGIGYGRQGTKPGKFYPYPGDPPPTARARPCSRASPRRSGRCPGGRRAARARSSVGVRAAS